MTKFWGSHYEAVLESPVLVSRLSQVAYGDSHRILSLTKSKELLST